MNNGLVSQHIIDILVQEMAIPDSDIWLANENRKVPDDDGLYFTVGFLDAQVMSSKSEMIQKDLGGGDFAQFERGIVRTREYINIDIFSRLIVAEERKHEILMALKSFYSQRKQEQERFKIFEIPNGFVNTSSAEGGSNIRRFTITIPTFVWYIKERQLSPDGGEYYDDFDTRVDDENTIGEADGLIEFNINEETEI